MAGSWETDLPDDAAPATAEAQLPVALVTNADGAQARGLVLDLLDAGYRVVLTGRLLAALARHLSGLDDRVYAIAADMADPWQAQRMRELVVARFGRLDEIIAADTGAVAHAAA
jgi:NAD(P)-dependent dehydrogenase (short-subunit alcohol dehydrogenase family)